ncbi:anaerobic sulfatase maturase [candidate division KSB1 bacterium]|nr:anaerobic sulfatase maturase [candidate division KSB1 bacterium]
MKPLNSLLIKPAGPDCNLNCIYCFYLQKAALFPTSAPRRMSREVLRETMLQTMQSGESQVNFGWQGGEPTLMGLPFFETAVQFQARYGKAGHTVGNGLQTNGLLIDASWAAFLRESQFLVGLSLDGPAHIHDRYRRFRSGKHSWEHTVRARDILLEAGVAVNALIVVNDYSVRFAREIYQFHKKNGLTYMQFIPCVEPGAEDATIPAPFSVPADAYGQFLCELFDLWRGDFRYGRPRTSIRWFDSLFYTYVGLPAPECTLVPECGQYLVVEHNGDVFSCDFYVDPQWRLGNVLKDNLTELLNDDLQTKFGKNKAVLPDECTTCPYLHHCYGGCPRERRFHPEGLNYFCSAWKQFFTYADPFFRQLAEEWKKEQGMTQSVESGK